MTPAEFSSAIIRLRREIEVAAAIGVREAAELVATEARNWIGRDHSIWPPLADATIQEKSDLDFETPDPLLRTGHLRDSIKVQAEGLHAIIGSDDPVAIYMEHGTSTIPPRPFLGPALHTKRDEVIAVIEANIAKAIRKII
jgi:HK97 gp10 family phage protein